MLKGTPPFKTSFVDPIFQMTNDQSSSIYFNKDIPSVSPPPRERLCPSACAKMFPALAEQTLNIPVSFQYSPSRIHRNYRGSGRGTANSGIVKQDSFKALNQSALMEEPDCSVRIWISLTGAPAPVLSTADQVTCHTVTWPTRLPVINKLVPSQYQCCGFHPQSPRKKNNNNNKKTTLANLINWSMNLYLC